VEHPEVVLHLLLPPDQDPAEPIHPAVGPLHDPTPGLEPRLTLQGLGLLTSGSDVGGEAEFLDIKTLLADPDRLVAVSKGS
jgi:hypothetical protein